jgi:YfiH family protein
VSSPPPHSLAQRIAAAGLDWIVPDWAPPPGVHALFTTRSGGVSTGPRATLNLGAGIGDADDAVAENRRRLLTFCPAPPRWMHQVHGTGVAAHAGQRDPASPVADAAITRERGVVCAVLTADCLPVVLADRRGGAVGIAHAGWRGLAAGVLERTVAELGGVGVHTTDLIAWLGPAIGPAAFEVGADVREAFLAVDPRANGHFVRSSPAKWHADLYGLARQRLTQCGVHSVGGGGFCTMSDATRFFSWRRDREGGRMAALVWLAPDGTSAHV